MEVRGEEKEEKGVEIWNLERKRRFSNWRERERMEERPSRSRKSFPWEKRREKGIPSLLRGEDEEEEEVIE